MTLELKRKRVLLTGGSGFLGSYVSRELLDHTCELYVPRSNKHDLRNSFDVKRLFGYFMPDIVINLAAVVGGIGYNQKHPYHLFYDNSMICLNVINEAVERRIEKFVQVGTVCGYPKWAKPPFKEIDFWDGYPEETNAPYGLAKKMSLVQLQAARENFGFEGIYVIPSNLYGPTDEFNPERSHVIAALIKKCYDAEKQDIPIEAWGTGDATRDFLYVEDGAKALVLLLKKYDGYNPINIGTGEQVSISVLLHHIMKIMNIKRDVIWNTSKPDGQPKRAVDISRIKDLGWKPETDLITGLKKTIDWWLENAHN